MSSGWQIIFIGMISQSTTSSLVAIEAASASAAVVAT